MSPEIDSIQKHLAQTYTEFWATGKKTESPGFAFGEMVLYLIDNTDLWNKKDILDIGSGNGGIWFSLVNYLKKQTSSFLPKHIITTDIASINPRLNSQYPQIINTQHVQANSLYPPFKNGIFDLLTAHFSIDFFPRDDKFNIFKIVNRMLAPGGTFLSHFHHHTLVNGARDWDPSTIEDPNLKSMILYWQYLEKNQLLFTTVDEIKHGLIMHNLQPIITQEIKPENEQPYYFVKAQKPSI